MKHLAITLALLSVVCLVGCDEVKGPYSIGSDKYPAGAYPRNVAVDPQLANALVAGQTRVNGGSKDQPMTVQQPMRNTKNFPLEIQYQFIFLDETGRQLPSSGAWKNLPMEPRVERFLEGAALDTNAVDWRLTVRPAK